MEASLRPFETSSSSAWMLNFRAFANPGAAEFCKGLKYLLLFGVSLMMVKFV